MIHARERAVDFLGGELGTGRHQQQGTANPPITAPPPLRRSLALWPDHYAGQSAWLSCECSFERALECCSHIVDSEFALVESRAQGRLHQQQFSQSAIGVTLFIVANAIMSVLVDRVAVNPNPLDVCESAPHGAGFGVSRSGLPRRIAIFGHKADQ